jgi:hypothetical protein
MAGQPPAIRIRKAIAELEAIAVGLEAGGDEGEAGVALERPMRRLRAARMLLEVEDEDEDEAD